MAASKSKDMNVLSDTNRPTSNDSRDEATSAEYRRQQIQHHRAKRLDRRDPSRTLSNKRARDAILAKI
jgi:DNA-nicking Smr family endonuclease